MQPLRFVGYVRYETTTVIELEQEFGTEAEADDWVETTKGSLKPGSALLNEPKLKTEVFESDVFRTDCNY